MTRFIPGLELCEAFYHEAVRPILDRRFPGIAHSAGRLDCGSEVMGFDTPQSMDHTWGPRTTLFLSDADERQYKDEILKALSDDLPYEIRGYPTNYASPEVDGGHLESIDHGPVCHGVTVESVHRYFEGYVGVDPLAGLDEIDWLLIPQQRLRTVASGRIFHDGLDALQRVRNVLQWYPKDLWLYMLACQWRRLDQEEPFMARCGDVGDELGSRIVATRLADAIMRLCFLMERQYAPYYKWFGKAFSRLACADYLTPLFHAVFDSQDWKEREKHLSAAYLCVAGMHNDLGVAGLIAPEISPFHSRPYQVPHSERFVNALRAQIESETIGRLPIIGAVTQFADSTDVLDDIERCKKFRALYDFCQS